ncbi:ATP-binding protein [Streptomyces sp. NEAU-Y11]|uniref:ATP-binding protein n=1 Tax=Streptomyces cucumeris TaxID=2962890 RepID=UPI0020C8CF42|nr:ATP-binding protein [Streptomyces sp. NEAU-Y11]MCP9211463.1 ATP-binding protein [Streptomyces sp. NEAU-Y11]
MSPGTVIAPAAASLRPTISGAFEVAIAPDPARVSDTRRITAAFVRLWSLPLSMEEEAVIVVSELVSNAVEHGFGLVSLRIRYSDDTLRIDVADDNPEPARQQSAGPEDVRGRGLFIVQKIAAAHSGSWGVSEDGRTTWCVLRVLRAGER